MRTLIFAIIVTIPLYCYSQKNDISIYQKDLGKVAKYDSLSNFTYQQNMDDYRKYIGQEVYFFPIVECSYEYGNNMRLIKPDTLWIKKVRKPKINKNYKLYYNYGWEYSNGKDDTNIKAFSGKVFKIVDVVRNSFSSSLVLSSNDNPTKLLIYNFSDKYHYESPSFILLGYWQKMKEKLIGKNFICNKNTSIIFDGKGMLLQKASLQDEKEICYTIKEIDLYRNFKYNLPAIIFSDTIGNKFPIRLVNYPSHNPLGMKQNIGIDWPNLDIFRDYKEFSEEKETYLSEINSNKEKIKKELDAKYLGKAYVNQFDRYYNINDKSKITIPKGVNLVCIGFVIDDKNITTAILENEQYGKVYEPISTLENSNIFESWNFKNSGYRGVNTFDYCYPLKSAEDLKREKNHKNELIKKYGLGSANLILKGEVRIGFTKTMCNESWGAPEDVNTTITGTSKYEQWVYSINTYLYFENGLLTAIQD